MILIYYLFTPSSFINVELLLAGANKWTKRVDDLRKQIDQLSFISQIEKPIIDLRVFR